LLNKIEHGKLDFVLGLPVEIEYLTHKYKFKNLCSIEIKELKGNPYTVSYFGISKTETGKKIIEEIDKILPKLRKTKEYRLAFERWINKDQLNKYRKDYRNIFLKNRIK